MRSRVFLVALAFLISSVFLPAARAQYMYMDSNGDGVHTSADVLSATGYTTADVWLDPTHNRDGSAAICDSHDGDLSIINSYSVNLRADGGTVEFSGFVNRIPSFSISCIQPGMPFLSSEAEASACQASGVPGTYAYPLRLFTLTVRVLSGTPSILFEERSNLSLNTTSFGTNCSGSDYDNTYKLMVTSPTGDWRDADGLPFGAGQPNRPPVLGTVADMSLPAGTVATQVVTATDPDFNSISIVRTSGPDYLHVVPLASDDGLASAQIVAAPFTKDIGSTTATIRASDGVATDERTFLVSVTSGPDHAPLLRAPARLTALAGAVTSAPLEASDPDGDQPGFVKVSGPDFAVVLTVASRDGGATGRLVLTPGACDIGAADVVISATDGMASRNQQVHVEVIAPQGAPADSALSYAASFAYGIGLGDVNGDGRTDAVLGASYMAHDVRVAFGTEGGFLVSPPAPAGTEPLYVAAGDFNGDGLADVASANYFDGTVTVLLASTGGSLGGRVDYPVSVGIDGIACADLDGDGHLDLVAGGDNAAYVLLGRGDGTFGVARSFPATAPGVFSCVAIEDFDLDGRLDVVVGRSILHGLGGGAFEPWTQIPSPFPSGCVAADWTGDGLPDLAFVDWGGIGVPPGMRLYRNAGDGTFPSMATATGLLNPQGFASADMDGDGDLDLAAGDWGLGLIRVWYLQNGSIIRQEDWPNAAPMDLDAADVNHDGYPDLLYTDGAQLQVRLNRNGAATTMPQARAFVRGGHRAVAIAPSTGTLSIFLEPLSESYRNDQLRPASLRLTSTGTGSVESIDAISGKALVLGDADHNDVPDVAVEFAAEDLARLFQNVTRLTTVHATVRGLLLDGRALCAAVDLDVVGTGPALVATIAPNPLNPQGTISFTTTRSGPLSVRLYDLMGRLVKTLCDSREAAPGLHRFTFDGTTDSGSRLASGAYFFKIEALEGTRTGRLVLLR
ncbi:MAG: FG-GAP-like repeat-containing protein [Bacteroidota bacterium]